MSIATTKPDIIYMSPEGVAYSSPKKKLSKLFDNWVTHKFINPEDIGSHKLKAAVITVLTGVAFLGTLVGMIYGGLAAIYGVTTAAAIMTDMAKYTLVVTYGRYV